MKSPATRRSRSPDEDPLTPRSSGSQPPRRRVSRGFLAALGGLAITTYAWFSSSVWPAWPGLALFPLVGDYLDPSSSIREAVVVLLIAVNVGGWAVVLHAAATLARRLLRRRRPPPGSGIQF